ncbi:Asp23/Gls24 family envelope stress response protein [Caldicellulosiruptor naganoensis]|uniref:Asp23/Gls24 family envelope stress response protein n=1 Tax=Caldicellulosiruptor naganoensis TaxID=29324 RepID=A0ABY7BJA7_9FIRM|nr:Asp23/Gls24 family envelope stress response protein [Caldicellulosiruptor naganoensis]WAM32570.1 Asp23/Gls24 family envelope stress response protein [Caldicellulosiruptor naganoensis]
MSENVINETTGGVVKIAEEVVAIIAAVAASEVKGVASMVGTWTGNITEALGKKNLAKGVKVQVGEKEAAIDIYITVEYGVRIPEVAWEIQERVKNAVESMTGLKVVEVNIHVQGIKFEKEEQKESSEE